MRVQANSLAPNPSDGNIELRQLEEDKRPVSMKVYNVVGAIVHSSSAVFDANAAMRSLGDIPAGVYYMVMRDGSGTGYTLQFIKR